MDAGSVQTGGNSHDEDPDGREPFAPTLARRSFLGWLLGVCTVSIGALLSVPLVRFALYPLRARTTQTAWSDLGQSDELASLTAPVRSVIKVQQVDGWREAVTQKSVYVTKGPNGRLEVLSSICPHLGCEIAWNQKKEEFFCPCHGGVFAPDGSRISGPPPRGMDSLPIAVKDGRLMVRYEYFRQLMPTKEVIG